MVDVKLFNEVTSRPDVSEKIVAAESAGEIRGILAENGLNLTEDEMKTVLEELGKSVEKVLADQDELPEEALDDVSGGAAMWTLMLGTSVFKASGTLAIVLGGVSGVALGVGAVALGIWAYKKYCR